MLSEEARGRIEKRLLEERESALEAIGHFDADERDLNTRLGETTVYRFHLADIGSEEHEREKEFLMASMEGRRLYAIDDALRRLYREPETFGVCERCGRDIGEERLDIVPQATLCAADQEAVEEG